MSKFIIQNKNRLSKENMVVEILRYCRNSNAESLLAFEWKEIVKNVEIGVSARFAECKIYGK